MVFLIFWVMCMSVLCSGSCATIRAARGAVNRSEAENVFGEFLAEFI